MFPQTIKTGLTLPKILTGINKTLNVANQIIPIYVQAKPMIQNMKSAFKVAKEFMSSTNKNTIQEQKKTVYTNQTNQIKRTQGTNNNPVFFLK